MALRWQISTCKHSVSLNGQTNVITEAWFDVLDSETIGSGLTAVEHKGQYSSSVQFDTSDLSSFITYDDVTEANVLSWVKETLGSSQVAAIEADVANQITESKAPAEVMGKPWS
jgi:hypothetical protein